MYYTMRSLARIFLWLAFIISAGGLVYSFVVFIQERSGVLNIIIFSALILFSLVLMILRRYRKPIPGVDYI